MTIYTTPESFEDQTPSASQRIGGSFTKGLTSGLELLAKDRLEKMKMQRTQDFLKELSSVNGQNDEGPSAAELAYLESIIPGGSKPFIAEKEAKQKSRIAETEEKSRVKHFSGVFKRLGELNKYAGPKMAVKMFNPEVRKNRQEMNSLALDLEKVAASMVGKGAMSDKRFNTLMRNLPSSDKTQADNEGAIKAWKSILKMPEFDETLSEIDFGEEKTLPNETISSTEVIMIDPEGNRFAVEKENIDAAKNAGYQLER